MAKIFNGRKLCSFLVLAAFLCAGGNLWAAANTKSKKMAIGIDTVPLFKGFIATNSTLSTSVFGVAAQFEYALSQNFGLGARMDLYNGTGAMFFALDVHGRYYPLSSGMEKLFLDLGIGFNTESGGGVTFFQGLTFSMKAGWKLFLTKGLFLEPALGYVYSKSGGMLGVEPLGWQLALPIGWAF